MNNLNDKVDKIVEDVGDLKIAVAKLEVSHEKSNDILERITESVEYHIKRSDSLEELVDVVKNEFVLLKQDQIRLDEKSKRINIVMYVLGAVGAVILGLNELGVLQKLFQ